MTMCADFAPPIQRTRIEDACHDVTMAVASAMVAIHDATTVAQAHAIQMALHSMWREILSAERSALEKQRRLL